ncbi:MAG: phage tail protein [Bryobacteraceae bacterium]
MSDHYVGQLMLFAFGYAPVGWAPCNGQTLPIQGNQPLFSLIGNLFGGDGVTNFKLPNLAGLTPIMASGTVYPLGATGGEATHTLTLNEVPSHNHSLRATGAVANSPSPTADLLATPSFNAYVNSSANPPNTMQSGTLQPFGGGQPHENRTPYLVMNWCIALSGYYPTQG